METPDDTSSYEEPPEIEALSAEMTPKQAAFARAAVEYNNWTRAYRIAYDAWDSSGNWVHQEASKLMQRPKVAALHAAYQKWHRKRHAATIESIVARVQAIADANPDELVKRVIGCCRHCWGEGFKYQRTQAEYDDVWARYAERVMQPRKAGEPEPAAPDDLGGVGFDRKRDPNPECHECRGEGVGRTVITDTRKLSPGAAALFAGIKETKDGTQVLMHSQLDAADKILRKLGAYVERKEISGPGGAPLAAAVLTTTDPVAAAQAYRDIMEKGAA